MFGLGIEIRGVHACHCVRTMQHWAVGFVCGVMPMLWLVSVARRVIWQILKLQVRWGRCLTASLIFHFPETPLEFGTPTFCCEDYWL